VNFGIFLTPEAWISLATLTLMEIVLGIDNIIFISILVGRMPEKQRAKARRIGISLALFMRLGLLATLSFIMGMSKPFFHVLGKGISGRDIILLGGGLFLVAKATHEIYEKLEVESEDEDEGEGEDDDNEVVHAAAKHRSNKFLFTILQILVLDIVFSLDSVITAVGMAQEVVIMVIAMVIAVLVMLVAAGKIGDFVNNHPSMKILALSFLLLIGVLLIAEGMGQHVSKGYIYFALGFSLLVELLNMRFRKKRNIPVKLHQRISDGHKASDTMTR
jgi:predicted tellurium resistance membrane protein TerC